MKVGANLLWAATAVLVGILVLSGYFLDFPFIQSIQTRLMSWAVLLAAAALFVGLYNLLSVHWNKIGEQKEGWPYSLTLMVAFLVTFFTGLFLRPDHPIVLLIFRYIHIPVEATLMGLLAVSLAVAGFRLISRRRDAYSLIFIGTAFLVLIGTAPWIGARGSLTYEFLGWVRNWLAQVLASGGARGILLGVALGAVLTGLRVILAVDRPYGD